MRYRFPYIGADLCMLVHQTGIQQTLQDHGYGLVYHAICLLTLLAFASNHASITTEGGLRVSRTGCLLLDE